MPEAVRFGPPVISVDVEDWPQSTWDRTLPITERAAVNTRLIADVLADCGVRGTMFVLGKVAERFPSLVRELHEQGHEIASHGYGHVEIFKQSRQQFADDIRRSKDILEQIIGGPVKGYRAPDFSVVPETLWALDVLADAGFTYDSSIFPVSHSRYGIPSWPVAPVRVPLERTMSMVEVPVATLHMMGRNWPIGGGGYHRLLPGVVFRHLAKRVMRCAPFVFYCHPYERDASELREIPVTIPFHVRLHQGLGRRRVTARLRRFLHTFGGRRIDALVESADWPDFSPGPGLHAAR